MCLLGRREESLQTERSLVRPSPDGGQSRLGQCERRIVWSSGDAKRAMVRLHGNLNVESLRALGALT